MQFFLVLDKSSRIFGGKKKEIFCIPIIFSELEFPFGAWEKCLALEKNLFPYELTVVFIALSSSSAGRRQGNLAVLGSILYMGKKSRNLRRAGWEIISCWEGVYHKRIHGFAICFLVTAVLVSSPEFHTLSQTEWLVLLAMIWKSFGYRRSLWHLIKVLMFVDKNLCLYYFNWWYGRGHIFFWWESRNYERYHHFPPSFVF